MKIIHFCAGLQFWNGMANTARQFVEEETAQGHESSVTDCPDGIVPGIDVVYIHGAWLPVLWKVAKRAKAVGAKLIIRPAGSYDPIRLAYHSWKKRLAAYFERKMLRLADVLLATCKAEAGWVRDYVGKDCPRVEISDLKRFFDLSIPVNYPQRTGMSVIHVLYLGRMHPLKGVKYLELAVADLNYYCMSRVPGCNSGCVDLRIVSGAKGAELEEIWKWADVLVLPTLSENFGRVIAEALERGKPVITTDGAPAWEDLTQEQGIYLKGFRDGSDEIRVKLLKDALAQFVE